MGRMLETPDITDKAFKARGPDLGHRASGLREPQRSSKLYNLDLKNVYHINAICFN